ncbi:MAG: metallophosphoesterase [Pyrinomonadaceae bacterium]|nr:metallophosphoesterase [Acidobacteriota bacterium]MBP7375958.1 metallophosphoesterase [Pyrinomonadaceae bacterium]
MRKIVHLSDIHFGTADPTVVDRLVEKVRELEPDIVVVSGDLTQRAKPREFREARQFLDRLPQPQIVVPGNHDVPLYNVYHRFIRGLDRFRSYISDDLNPAYFDEELGVIGVNTARSLTFKGGRINDEQVKNVRRLMAGHNSEALMVIVTHHPFDIPAGFSDNLIVGRAKRAMPQIADLGGDLFLAGHLHVSNTDTTAARYQLAGGRTALLVQAGTAASARVRGESNSFNLIRYCRPKLYVERFECNSHGVGFEFSNQSSYEKGANGWEQIDSEEK